MICLSSNNFIQIIEVLDTKYTNPDYWRPKYISSIDDYFKKEY